MLRSLTRSLWGKTSFIFSHSKTFVKPTSHRQNNIAKLAAFGVAATGAVLIAKDLSYKKKDERTLGLLAYADDQVKPTTSTTTRTITTTTTTTRYPESPEDSPRTRRKCRVCSDSANALSFLQTLYSTDGGDDSADSFQSFRAIATTTGSSGARSGVAKLGIDSNNSQNSANSQQSTNHPSTHSGKRKCPPTYRELGNSTWLYLHTMAAYYPEMPPKELADSMPEFLRTFAAVFPCEHCRDHMQDYMIEHPVDARSNETLSLWMCKFHNAVNANLGKPQSECDADELIRMYRDGPTDGSCD